MTVRLRKTEPLRLLPIITMVSSLGLLACATTGEQYTRTHYTGNYISLKEIKSSAAINAYDLINNLRPHWLRGRGPKSFNRYIETSLPAVYLDGIHFGNIQSLASIPVESIVVIQLLGGSEATIKLGGDNPSGAILITTLSQ